MNNPFPEIEVTDYRWWYTNRGDGFRARTNFGTIQNDGIGDENVVLKDWTGPKNLSHEDLESILDYWAHMNPEKIKMSQVEWRRLWPTKDEVKDAIRRRAGEHIAEKVVVIEVGDNAKSKSKSAIFEGMVRQSLGRPKEKRCSLCGGEKGVQAYESSDGRVTCSLCVSWSND